VAEAATAMIDDHQEVPDNAELVSVALVVLVLPVFLLDRNRSLRANTSVRPRSLRTHSSSNILSISSIRISKIWEGTTHPTPYLSILINQTHLSSLTPAFSACNLDNLNLDIRQTPLNWVRVRCNGTVMDIPQPPRDMGNGPLLPVSRKATATSASSSNSSNSHLCPQL
jgi:hypothetical protein